MSEISPIRPSGCSWASCACVSTACIGVLMTPGATAFTLMPRFAYSIASDLVAALKPPFVSEASTDGTWEFACSIRLVVICTTWPLCRFSISAIAICFDKGCAHALRGASDDGNLPFAAHARLLHSSTAFTVSLQDHP